MPLNRPQVPSRTAERICFALCVFAVLSAFMLLIAPDDGMGDGMDGNAGQSSSTMLALFAMGSIWSALSFGAGLLLRARRRRKEAALQAYKEKLARAPIDW